MADEPFLDPSTFESARVVGSRETILEHIPHRGRFALLDGLLDADPSGALAVGFKEIRADDWWAPDHIPGRPIFPGVLMCEAAAQLCSYHLVSKHPDRPEGFLGFAGMNETRFRGIVTPPSRLVIVAKPGKLRSRMFTYTTQGFVAGKLVFATEILGTFF